MHFLNSKIVFLGLLIASATTILINVNPVQASAPLNSTYSATVPTVGLGTYRQIRVDPANGTAYVLGSSTSVLGSLSADGNTYSSIPYSSALPVNSTSDLAISGGKAFIVINGATNAIYRYDINDGTASFVASSTLTTGISAVTFGDGIIYASKGATIYSFNSNLDSVASNASASSPVARLAYGGGNLFYLSTGGRFARIVLGVSDNTIISGGPTSATVKGFAASNNGSALYYASTSGFSKISATDGTLFWTRSMASIAGMDVNTSTGRITILTSSGAVTNYNPINAVSSFSSSASGTSATLNWTTGVFDSDFSGVTIRRSLGSFPLTATDGTAVTSSDSGTSFTDTDLDEGTYYYSIFNQTSDGYYSPAATSTVTIDLPPSAPSLFAEATDNTVSLSWSVPSDTNTFEIRRDTTDFPLSHLEGSTVTTTENTVTNLVQSGMPDGTYFYSIFAIDAGGNYSPAGTASIVVDTTPPAAPILDITASSSDVYLSWNVPATTESFLLRHSLVSFPTTISEGMVVTSTIATDLVHVGLIDGTHYYSIFARDSYGNYSTAGMASVVIDTTAPSAPTLSAHVTGSTNTLSWNTPLSAASFVLRRSPFGFPSSISEGSGVTTTLATSFTETSLPDGSYYYSIFAADSFGNYSTAGTAAIMVDTTAPSTPTSFSAISSGNTVSLTWVNPIDSDFSSSTIRRSTLSFPTSITDGTAITSTLATSYADQSLADGTYYYSIFAVDMTGNASTNTTSRAIVNTYIPPAPPTPSGGGGGSPSIAPSALNTAPLHFSVSDLTVAGANTVTTVSSPTITLHLNANPSTVRGYAASLDPLFNNASIFPLSPSGDVLFPLPDKSGLYTIYLKYYSITGQSSPVFTQTVTYTPAQTSVSASNPLPSLKTSLPNKTTAMFTRTLKQGDQGSDVKALQIFLNTRGFLIAKTGQGSPGRETTFFGPATTKAIKKFQEANRAVILKPYNLDKGTGVFGVKMKEMLNALS